MVLTLAVGQKRNCKKMLVADRCYQYAILVKGICMFVYLIINHHVSILYTEPFYCTTQRAMTCHSVQDRKQNIIHTLLPKAKQIYFIIQLSAIAAFCVRLAGSKVLAWK